MVCIVCGSPQIAGLAPWHARCRACQYESASLQVAINDHVDGPGIDEAQREASLKALRLENFKTITTLAQRCAPGGRRLLDVGSAHGWFLETASERFEVLGIEPDEAVREPTLARGLPVRAGYFPDALQAGETFDVIVFNDVIEHIPDIRSALGACRERLTADGILILNLPNSRGFFYRLSKLMVRCGWRAPFERLWQKGMPSPHVHYFDNANLATLLHSHGFEPAHSEELPVLRAAGLLQRMRYAGNIPTVSLYLQYVLILATIPLLRLFPSDIIVCIFRKKTAA